MSDYEVERLPMKAVQVVAKCPKHYVPLIYDSTMSNTFETKHYHFCPECEGLLSVARADQLSSLGRAGIEGWVELPFASPKIEHVPVDVEEVKRRVREELDLRARLATERLENSPDIEEIVAVVIEEILR